ncbi:DUF4139 domain-containing protein [Sphingomonas sp. 28-62-20]|uniref:DUF4139 domain-containing protein n=1 Tax=Sphingomonas sp. 28-62-20 TaxID=1970433 RepID=UPI0026A8A3C9
MRGLLALAALIVSAGTVPAAAQQLVTSAGPEKVSVTVYRAPYRDADEAIDRSSPDGYALITETRTVTLPAGRTTIRFEGVAGNIFPESAIIAGLAQGVREKNLDADLLSARSLYDRALGRRVIIRRTNKVSGKVSEEQATIRSGVGGAAVVQTGGGVEALRCSGLPETILYEGVPEGLSAKPTLSIEVDSVVASTSTITLSYLAGGFDWQADYVIRLAPGGARADIFAWVTLASSDVTSFAQAGTQVIAGKPNRESTPSFGDFGSGSLSLKCWPTAGARRVRYAFAPPPPPPPPAPAMMAMAERASEDIIVSGTRKVAQEELGDFKLYRIADPVTVASRAQKQVGLLSKESVQVAIVYASDVDAYDVDDPIMTIRAKNRREAGLGLPLPAGRAAVFEAVGGRPILVGESATDDKAIGEDIEFKLGQSPSVTADTDEVIRKGRRVGYRLTVTNANPWPIAYEAKFAPTDGRMTASATLGRRDGKALWAVSVPANGTATLDYTIRQNR